MTNLLPNYNIVTVEGNTGAGKTSLAVKLAQESGANLVLEKFVENPYLPKLYAGNREYAFRTETYFLMDRYEQLHDLHKTEHLTITDYIPQKSLLYAKANLDSFDYPLFEQVFNTLFSKLPEPDLIIYVHATVSRLLKNIKQRGRDFEQAVNPNYLQHVEDIYFTYFEQIKHIPILIIEADNIDFVNQVPHYEQIKTWLSKTYAPGIHRLTLKKA